MMCSKCSELKSNHQLQHGQQPLHHGVHRLTEASVPLNNLTKQAARGGQQNTSTESFQSWCNSSYFQK